MYLRQVYKHHINQAAIEDVQAKRIFEGVQKNPQEQGQIFGYKNILEYRPEGVLNRLLRGPAKTASQEQSEDEFVEEKVCLHFPLYISITIYLPTHPPTSGSKVLRYERKNK